MRRIPSTIQNRTEEPSASLNSEVTPTGTTKKRPIASSSEAISVPAHIPPEIGSSSSGSWALAEIPSALKPILSDSTSATTPRMTGSRSTRWRRVHDENGNDVISIPPSGSPAGPALRTATAHVVTPRIMTPSRTAWPPTGASRCGGSATSSGAEAVSVTRCAVGELYAQRAPER